MIHAVCSQVEAAGPLWVAPAAGSGAGDGAEGGVLVAVLTQSVRVELTVTLHELERPHAHEAADALVQVRGPVAWALGVRCSGKKRVKGEKGSAGCSRYWCWRPPWARR